MLRNSHGGCAHLQRLQRPKAWVFPRSARSQWYPPVPHLQGLGRAGQREVGCELCAWNDPSVTPNAQLKRQARRRRDCPLEAVVGPPPVLSAGTCGLLVECTKVQLTESGRLEGSKL